MRRGPQGAAGSSVTVSKIQLFKEEEKKKVIDNICHLAELHLAYENEILHQFDSVDFISLLQHAYINQFSRLKLTVPLGVSAYYAERFLGNRLASQGIHVAKETSTKESKIVWISHPDIDYDSRIRNVRYGENYGVNPEHRFFYLTCISCEELQALYKQNIQIIKKMPICLINEIMHYLFGFWPSKYFYQDDIRFIHRDC